MPGAMSPQPTNAFMNLCKGNKSCPCTIFKKMKREIGRGLADIADDFSQRPMTLPLVRVATIWLSVYNEMRLTGAFNSRGQDGAGSIGYQWAAILTPDGEAGDAD